MNLFSKILLTGLVFSSAFKAYATEVKVSVPVDVMVYHNSVNGNECDMGLVQEAEAYSLDQKATLVLIPCSRGAYQTGYVGYVMNQHKNVSAIVVLTWEGYLTTTNWLTEASYDSTTGLISTFGKARGLGDCGEYSTHKVIVDEYGYVSVKTVEIASQACLDEPTEDAVMGEWPIVFAQ